MLKETNLDNKCKALNCPYYIEWDYYGSHLVSCKLQGESDHIDKPAYNCPHEDELNTQHIKLFKEQNIE